MIFLISWQHVSNSAAPVTDQYSMYYNVIEPFQMHMPVSQKHESPVQDSLEACRMALDAIPVRKASWVANSSVLAVAALKLQY